MSQLPQADEEELLMAGAEPPAERKELLPRKRSASSAARAGWVSALVLVLLFVSAAVIAGPMLKSKAVVRGGTMEAWWGQPVEEPEYTRHEDKNAYHPYGAVDIDTESVTVASEEECMQRCTDDSQCDCVTWLEETSKCWKRRECIVKEMTSPYNEGYTTFMKNEAEETQRIADERRQEEENSDYFTWRDTNAYEPFGAVDIDGVTGARVNGHIECQQRCTDDPQCDCVTFLASLGGDQCWKRCDCDKSKMNSTFNKGYTTYKKKLGAAEECPPPCVKDDEFREAALEKLKRREDGAGYTTLAWSDDFDGWGIDESKWLIWEDEDDSTINNNELQMYRRGNAYVENGLLRLQAKCEKAGKQNFTSAKLHSRMLFRAGHRVEARLRMSSGNGTWPAFWLMGSGKDPWPMIGELDILEYVGCSKKVMGNLHFEHRHSDNCLNTYTKEPYEDVGSWHTFQVDWISDGMIFYIDGERLATIPAENCYKDWPYNTNEFCTSAALAQHVSQLHWM